MAATINVTAIVARIASVFLLSGILACGGSPTSPSARDYSGSWSGTTAQGKSITFQVSGNTVTGFTVGYVVQGRFQNFFGSGTCTADGTVKQSTTIIISNDAFTYSGTNNVSSLVGDFASSTSASGTLTFTLTDASSCAGTTNSRWTATRG